MKNNDFADIMAALSTVPDVDIDPETGIVNRNSKGSLSDKYNIKENIKSEKVREMLEKNEQVSLEEKSDAKNICDAYKDLMGIKKPEISESSESKIIDVEPLQNEDLLMESYIKQINKKGRK
jgi:hypothetical protein